MKPEIKPCKCGRTPHVKRYEWPWGPDTFGVVCDCGFCGYKFFVSPDLAIKQRRPTMTNEAKERAIRWLTEEVRSLRLAPTVNGCKPDNWAEQLEVMETCLELVRGCNQVANKSQFGCDPLIMEQLREMGGQPYWHVGLQDDSPEPHWKILDLFVAKHPEDYGYGKRWLAYAYPPANIDREVWVRVEDGLPADGEEVIAFAPKQKKTFVGYVQRGKHKYDKPSVKERLTTVKQMSEEAEAALKGENHEADSV